MLEHPCGSNLSETSANILQKKVQCLLDSIFLKLNIKLINNSSFELRQLLEYKWQKGNYEEKERGFGLESPDDKCL